eukprot:330476-Pyramimonas_sp.AAC.1
MDAEAAARELSDYIIQLKLDGQINATQACILSFWASRAGASGMVTKLAWPPGKQSGSYSSHFDRVVLPKGDNIHRSFYSITVPAHRRSDATRCTMEVPALNPIDLVVEEFGSNASKAKADVAIALAEGRLPAAYTSHPVVQGASHGECVLPFGMYLDKVPFERTDSVLGVWLYNILSGLRFLVVCLRASEMCKCGCRGHCSLYP